MRHLTEKDRYYIEISLKRNKPVKEIASDLGFSKVAIYAEIKKGLTVQRDGATYKDNLVYLYDRGQAVHNRAWANTGRKKKYSADNEVVQQIVERVKEMKYSPEASILSLGLKFCVKTFYNYVHDGYLNNITVYNLPYAKPHKKKKKENEGKRVHHENHKSIEDRPKEIMKRNVYGHWEMDTVYSSKDDKSAILVLSERCSREEIIIKMKDRTSASVNKAIDRLEKRLGAPTFRNKFKTITCDNGVEFSDSFYIEKSKFNKGQRTVLYYCHPYSSSERGTNENINRMIRRWIPKGDDIGLYTDREIKEIESWINNYPRKIFNGKSSTDMVKVFA